MPNVKTENPSGPALIKQYTVARSGNVQNKYTVCTVYPYHKLKRSSASKYKD